MKKTEIHLIQYLTLIAILGAGFYGILFFKDNKELQILSAMVMGFAYLMWGIAHHLIDKTFHRKIVIEYTLLAIVVATLLIILLSIT